MWVLICVAFLAAAIYLGLIRAKARPSAYLKAPVLVLGWFLIGSVLMVLGELFPAGAPRMLISVIVMVLTVGLSYRTGRSRLGSGEAAAHFSRRSAAKQLEDAREGRISRPHARQRSG